MKKTLREKQGGFPPAFHVEWTKLFLHPVEPLFGLFSGNLSGP